MQHLNLASILFQVQRLPQASFRCRERTSRIRHSFFQPLLTRFDSKFDKREAYCLSSNDVYKNSSSSEIEKNGWETSHFPSRFSMIRSLTLFADTFPCSLNSAGRDAGFFPTKDKLQIQRQDQRKSFERICCTV